MLRLRLRHRPRPLPLFLRREYLAKRGPTWRQLNDPHRQIVPFLDTLAELCAEVVEREQQQELLPKRLKLRFRPCT
jgi:hypothetical protein